MYRVSSAAFQAYLFGSKGRFRFPLSGFRVSIFGFRILPFSARTSSSSAFFAATCFCKSSIVPSLLGQFWHGFCAAGAAWISGSSFRYSFFVFRLFWFSVFGYQFSVLVSWCSGACLDTTATANRVTIKPIDVSCRFSTRTINFWYSFIGFVADGLRA